MIGNSIIPRILCLVFSIWRAHAQSSSDQCVPVDNWKECDRSWWCNPSSGGCREAHGISPPTPVVTHTTRSSSPPPFSWKDVLMELRNIDRSITSFKKGTVVANRLTFLGNTSQEYFKVAKAYKIPTRFKCSKRQRTDAWIRREITKMAPLLSELQHVEMDALAIRSHQDQCHLSAAANATVASTYNVLSMLTPPGRVSDCLDAIPDSDRMAPFVIYRFRRDEVFLTYYQKLIKKAKRLIRRREMNDSSETED